MEHIPDKDEVGDSNSPGPTSLFDRETQHSPKEITTSGDVALRAPIGTNGSEKVRTGTGRGVVVGVRPPRNEGRPTYIVDPCSGCWLWQRALDKDGYGYFRSSRKVVRAHRYYYELHKGPIPDGTEPDHTCRNRKCVNPDHLDPVTHLENVHRGGRCNRLNYQQAQEIRALRGMQTYKVIAARYAISESLVAHVMTNRVWNVDGLSASPSAGRPQ